MTNWEARQLSLQDENLKKLERKYLEPIDDFDDTPRGRNYSIKAIVTIPMAIEVYGEDEDDAIMNADFEVKRRLRSGLLSADNIEFEVCEDE